MLFFDSLFARCFFSPRWLLLVLVIYYLFCSVLQKERPLVLLQDSSRKTNNKRNIPHHGRSSVHGRNLKRCRRGPPTPPSPHH